LLVVAVTPYDEGGRGSSSPRVAPLPLIPEVCRPRRGHLHLPHQIDKIFWETKAAA